MIQPGLLILGPNKFFLKLETEAVCLPVGCVAEAVGYLCASYHIFHCDYPPLLHMVYGFVEELFDIPLSKRTVKASISISSLMTRISAAMQTAVNSEHVEDTD